MIDRPYTLPQGVSSWKVVEVLALSQDPSWNSEFSTVFFPFFWEQGVTDRLSVVWFPLPLEMRYQAIRTDDYRMGVGLNIFANILYQFQGFNWTPFLDVDHRIRLGHDFTLDWNTHLQLEIRRGTPAFHYGVLNWIGPVAQLTDLTHFQVQGGILYEYGNPMSLYIGRSPVNPGTGPFWRFPVRAGLGHLFHQQWQATVFWNGNFIGLPPGYSNQSLFLELTHFF